MKGWTLALALWLPAAVWGAAGDGKRAELRDVQDRLGALKRDLAKSEESRASAADQLKTTETAISRVNRQLRELGEERAAVQTALADLDQQSRKLGRQIDGQQQQLSRLLFRQFVHGEADALQLLLAGEDPNQLARDQVFLQRLSQAKAALLDDLRSAREEKQRLADQAQVKNARLADIEKQQQEGRAALLAQQRERQTVLARIADRVKAQRREIDTLKANEKRLTKLIEDLARAPRVRAPTPTRPRGGNAPPPLRNEATPDPAGVGGAFAALKGKLRLPVRGELANRFGSPRAEGGAVWKGLFIRAAEGSDVRAVAPGTVVFADWLRGFGNLLILDHGNGFLSVYGNNQSLFREAGQAVRGGDVVAAVGNSGGNAESGLYFELRHQGQPFDPLKWASLR